MADLRKKVEQNTINRENGEISQSQSHSTTEYKCPKCKDLGLIFIDNNTARQCDCVLQIKIERLMRSSEITEEFRKLSFENFETVGKESIIIEAYNTAVSYYKKFDEIKNTRSNSIALLGQPGAGKTHLLMAIANRLITKKVVSVHYFPFVEGFNDLKDDFDLLEEKIDRMKKVDVLFIDDLFKGREMPTPFQIEQMFAVINYRYLNHKPILVSSEKMMEDLLDIDEALGSRIKQMTKDFLVEIEGDRKLLNYRLAN
jgi:DNA replication protein DnaC